VRAGSPLCPAPKSCVEERFPRPVYLARKPEADYDRPMPEERTSKTKLPWSGRLLAVQPRIRLIRSFDQRYHSYQGYVLCAEGKCGEETGLFLVAVGKSAHEKHRFQRGMELSGVSAPVEDRRREVAGLYRTSGIIVMSEPGDAATASPPFHGVPPDLRIYRDRGHRRLAARTYTAKCTTCIWGCIMPVEMIIDHWNPSEKQYRFETFCYGPLNCSLHKAGPTRKVPGRKGMVYEEEDWVDEDATSHRPPNE